MKIKVILVGMLSITANAQTCSDYVVESGGKDLVFSNYLFTDFRNLAGGPRAGSVDIASDAEARKKSAAEISTAFFANYRSTWQVQTWGRNAPTRDHPVVVKNDADNVFVDYDPSTGNKGTMLSLTTERLQDGTQSAGEIAGTFVPLYGSVRFEARVTGDAGACGGLFFYEDDTHELDFEFLTEESNSYIHLTNQPGRRNGEPVPAAHTNSTLRRPYNQWHTYRLDWFPGLTRYYVNGANIVNKTVNVPDIPMKFLMNMWSDGSKSWSGEMKIGGKARLDIRYFVIAYDTAETVNASKDGIKCKLQGEMDGQGVIAPRSGLSTRETVQEEIITAKKLQGGSVTARAARLVRPGIIDKVDADVV